MSLGAEESDLLESFADELVADATAAESGAGSTVDPPGTKAGASFESVFEESAEAVADANCDVVGTKAGALAVKVKLCPGTNSNADGLNENSFAFGLSGMVKLCQGTTKR